MFVGMLALSMSPSAARDARTATSNSADVRTSGMFATAPLAAQSLLERSPNLGGTWTAEPGVLHFHFLHRFQATGAPARKVLNSPTFLLALGLPHRTSLGVRYATNSLVRTGFPNEWEPFARWQAAVQSSESSGAPVDVLVHAGWNQAAASIDGEVTMARSFGGVRVLGAVRAFSNAWHAGSARGAIAAGLAIPLHEWVAVAGDIATVPGAGDTDPAWSAGIQLRIPYSPHTLSLHASNANSTTLQGASRGINAVLWGFEFTVPFTPRRYFGSRGETAATAPADAGDIAADVTMTDRLLFAPDTVVIRVGSAVRWTNTSVLPHTVTADPDKVVRGANVQLPAGADPFDSGNMDPGAVYVHRFTVPGTYRYVCVPHELAGMIGVVLVQP
ncbi:MAG: hypothetical protein KFH98_13155 [Gemmatimonadetes bacterium]|nr:hypothetical protein [Gemmatimonadota bacterium]